MFYEKVDTSKVLSTLHSSMKGSPGGAADPAQSPRTSPAELPGNSLAALGKESQTRGEVELDRSTSVCGFGFSLSISHAKLIPYKPVGLPSCSPQRAA